MMLAQRHQKVAILGGGDGLAAREVLRYPGVASIDLVDLDPAMTQLGLSHPVITRLNDSALHDPRVEIVNADAYKFIEQSSDFFDVVIIDLPDPNNTGLGKLYSESFYRLLQRRLSVGGVVISQSTSPYFAADAFWCIHHTMEQAFPVVLPINVYVPSFGQWGFNLAQQVPQRDTAFASSALQQWETQLGRQPSQGDTLRFLRPEILEGLLGFDRDIAERPTEVNQLDNQALIQYYEASWDRWR